MPDADRPTWREPATSRPRDAALPGERGANRRVDLILEQIDSLPTLSTVAVRLLQVTADDDADVSEIVRLVSADVALTTRLLQLCRTLHRGRARAVSTVQLAVVLLGLDALRSAVLSLQVYETLRQAAADREEAPEGTHRFDRAGFWRHSLGVATAARLIAEAHLRAARDGRFARRPADLPQPEEAYVAGLLHDLGKAALDLILPRSMDRVLALTEQYQVGMAEIERRVIGVDHHTAGKRLAEYWRLTHVLQDVIWLHGQPYEALPDLDHRDLIALVTVADLVVRQQHIGFSGNQQRGEDLDEVARDARLDPDLVRSISADLHRSVAEQAQAIGLDESPGEAMLLSSIGQANQALGRLNNLLQERSRQSVQQARVLGAITEFHAAASPGRSVLATLAEVTRSAAGLFGEGLYVMLYQGRGEEDWQVYQFTSDGRLSRSQEVAPPSGCPTIADLSGEGQLSMRAASVLPWLADFLGDAVDIRDVHLLPLHGAWGVTAVLAHDRVEAAGGMSAALLQSLTSTWAAAVAAAAQHTGAKQLGEQLVEANRALAETQHKLTEARALARLGEMAKGAAHEMNNPLTIISGRSQLLASRLQAGAGREEAQAIAEQAHRLSDLITALHLFASPPRPQLAATDLHELIERVVSEFHRRFPDVEIRREVPASSPEVLLDAAQIVAALSELLQNAGEAQPRSFVSLHVQAAPADDRLCITVTDDGVGMDRHCLEHAFDPFFSAKPAGRQAGLGLARAQRLVEGHGGTVEIDSRPGQGASARVLLPLRSPEEEQNAVPDAA